MILPKQKVEGGYFRTDWNAEVVDFSALLKAVVGGKAPSTLLITDASAIKKFASSVKDSIKVPGLKFYSRQTPIGR